MKSLAVMSRGSYRKWLKAFVDLEQEYVNNLKSVLQLDENFHQTKYKKRVGRKVRRSRFAKQTVPLLRKIIAFHEKQIEVTKACPKKDDIGAVSTTLTQYIKTLKKLIWVLIPFANSYAPAVEAVQRLAARPEILTSRTLQTNVVTALDLMGAAVSYPGRSYAFFAKFLSAAQDSILKGSGDASTISYIVGRQLPEVLSELESMASQCMTTALEGRLHELLKRFPGLAPFIEDQELLNYGECNVKNTDAPPVVPSKKSSKKRAKSERLDDCELYLFSRMLIRVTVNSVHSTAALHGILLEQDDLCLTSDGVYARLPGSGATPAVAPSKRPCVENLDTAFKVNFGCCPTAW